MQVLFENIKEDFKKYNIISKYIIIFGSEIIASLIFMIVVIGIRNYLFPENALIFFFEDLLECLKECIGSVYLSAFVLEFLHLNIK